LFDEKRFRKRVAGLIEVLRNGLGDGLFTAQSDEENWGIARTSACAHTCCVL
jgi:cytochrome P450/NADPH-cytochrome P450 reductase